MPLQSPNHQTNENTPPRRKAVTHPPKEVLRRAANPRFVGSAALRVVMDAWHGVSPREFSVLYRRVRPYTMCSSTRLKGLYSGVRSITERTVYGDIVECGCAQGGSAALMALTLKSLRTSRRLWLFDTFEGLPAPTCGDPDYEIAKLFTGDCVGTLEEVETLFQRLLINDDVHFVKGLFQKTLPTTNIPLIALLHIDGDWFESVKVCLENLYDKVVRGGIIQFDDYGYWQGAKKAVDEFFASRGINVPLQPLDYSGRFIFKP